MIQEADMNIVLFTILGNPYLQMQIRERKREVLQVAKRVNTSILNFTYPNFRWIGK